MNKYPLPGQTYQHYKGGVYEIITLSSHTENREVLVIYKSIPFGTVYARPLDIWNESVNIEDKEIQRFTLLN
jgi:hypothetical protein